MTWHVQVVDAGALLATLGTIRNKAGTIIRCCPCPEGYRLTYVTADR